MHITEDVCLEFKTFLYFVFPKLNLILNSKVLPGLCKFDTFIGYFAAFCCVYSLWFCSEWIYLFLKHLIVYYSENIKNFILIIMHYTAHYYYVFFKTLRFLKSPHTFLKNILHWWKLCNLSVQKRKKYWRNILKEKSHNRKQKILMSRMLEFKRKF